MDVGGERVQYGAFEHATGDADNQGFSAQIIDIGGGFTEVFHKMRSGHRSVSRLAGGEGWKSGVPSLFQH